MPRLTYSMYAHPGDEYHISRLELGDYKYSEPHTSDFHEVFWVESGSGVHFMSDTQIELRPGHVAFVRPDVLHNVMGAKGHKVKFVNVAFPSTYASHCATPTCNPFTDSEVPYHTVLDGHDLTFLTSYARLLVSGDRSELKITAFLKTLALLLVSRDEDSVHSRSAPPWLQRAIRDFSRTSFLQGGTKELVRLAGRGPDHVAREMKKWYGKTPTEFVNEVRMDFVARRLLSSAVPIPLLADEVGLPNLSHFYRLFNDKYGLSPAAYRTKGRI